MANDRRLFVEFMRYFGLKQGSSVIGLCLALELVGETPESLESAPERTTRWRLRRKLKAFSEDLRARGLGYLLEDGDEITSERMVQAAKAV